ncbi:MAG: chemotaxis protein CheC [Planctomycetota bacterium]|nr:chemotaxis protein CheC [Planctomycetota bacterium]
MQLTPLQQDAVTELINIAFSRAAASLSDLTKCRVDLDVPEISVHKIGEVAVSVGRFVRGDVATVHQVFTGPVAGDAFLLLNFDGAVHLVELLTDTPTAKGTLGAAAREVVTEVGNILMNACLGVFGNLLQVRFSFSVPKLSLEDLGFMVQSLVVSDDALQHAMVVGARFRMRESEVTGCLVLVLGIASFELFLKAVEDWAEKSLAGDQT